MENRENGNLPAFAAVTGNPNNPYLQEGLTKREYFAAMAMQGLLTNLFPTSDNQLCPNEENVKYMATLSVKASDELLTQLNKAEE